MASQPAAGPGAPPTLTPPQTQFWYVPFIYEMDFGALAAGANANGNIQIQADADFKWIKSTYFCDLAGAAQTESTKVIPLETVQINDSSTGANLFSAAVPVPSYFGRGELPFILPVPYIFKARSSLSFTLTNYSAGTLYTNTRLSLIGCKIYRGGMPPAGAGLSP